MSGLFEILIAITSLSAGAILFLNLRHMTRLRRGSQLIVGGLLVIGVSALIDASNGFVPYTLGQLEPVYDWIEGVSYIGDALGLLLISVGFFRWLPLLRRIDSEVTARQAAEQSLLRTLDRSRELNQIKRELAQDHLTKGWNYDHMTRQVVQRLIEALDVQEAGLWLFSDDQSALRPHCVWSRTEGEVFNAPRVTEHAAPLAFRFARRGAYIESSDIAMAHEDARSLGQALHTVSEGAVLAAPILQEHGVSGVLSVCLKGEHHEWTPEELALIYALANYIVVAELVLNARTLAQSARDAQSAAERASAAKTEFVANVSHELRTPLSGMLGLVRVLSEAELEPALHDKVELLNVTGDQLLRVLNDLLDLSRLEAGRFQLEPAATDPTRILTEITMLFRPSAEQKGLILEEQIEALPASVELDETRFRQCVFNLLSNAIKFTDTGGVSLKASAQSLPRGQCRITVSIKDTGPGIDRVDVDKLFHRFEQGPGEANGQKSAGSGLGLVITRELARRMGGDVTLDSQPGEGSCFTLTLTAGVNVQNTVALAAQSQADAAHPGATLLSGARVLLVDDNDINRMVARYMVEPTGAEVIEAASGAAALRLFADDPFDLVLLDASMPVMSGEETLKRLRALNEAGAHVPVIALTAHAGQGERQRFLAMGMDDYIPKPIIEDELIAACERCLKHSHPA
ncbi:ATP-binding protein [Oceanicaulis sp.]|uniref:hybrid sensor histidine kinase/response regulator n=1 Tax=Oceanicaulis sp. TaxID=1924941 RepID=UPI003F71E26E